MRSAVFAVLLAASSCVPKCPDHLEAAPSLGLGSVTMPDAIVVVHSASELRGVMTKLSRELETTPRSNGMSTNDMLPSEAESFESFASQLDFVKYDVAVLRSGDGHHVTGQRFAEGVATVYSSSYCEPGPAGGDPGSYAAARAPYESEQPPGVTFVVIPKGARVETKRCSEGCGSHASGAVP